MPYPWIKALHFIGLALLLGGPVFWHFIRYEGPGDERRGGARNAAGWITFAAGVVLFLLSGYLDAVRAARDLWGELLPGDMYYFLTEARYGMIIMRKSVLTVVFAVVTLMRPRHPVGRGVLGLLGLGIVYHVSVASHSASGGMLGLLADMLHVSGLAVWGGGLVHFAVSPWTSGAFADAAVAAVRAGFAVDADAAAPAVAAGVAVPAGSAVAADPASATDERGGSPVVSQLARTARRFSWIGIVFVSLLVGSGLYMATQLIYGIIAVTGTPYGGALLRKVGLLAALLGVAGVNHYYFVPGLEKGDTSAPFVRRFRLAVWGEVVLLFLILVMTGVLTTTSPPKEAQAIPRPMHQTGVLTYGPAGAGGQVRYEIALRPSPAGNLLFDLRLEDAEGRPVTVPPPTMDLTMPEHLMPPYYATLQRVGAGHYQADLILPMSGRWVIYIQSELDGVALDDIVLDFRTAASPREQQREWYVSHWRATRWPLGPLALAVWAGLAVLAVFSIRRGREKAEFKPLLVTGSLLLFFSLWQVGSLFLAKGYPTEFQPNPIARSEEVLATGERLFVENCSVCHGPQGRGDGPARDEMWPPPSDLTIHVPWHPDGELYWFVTKGVNGTDMPSFEHALTDEERWTIVHYLRTLPADGPRTIWFPGERVW